MQHDTTLVNGDIVHFTFKDYPGISFYLPYEHIIEAALQNELNKFRSNQAQQNQAQYKASTVNPIMRW